MSDQLQYPGVYIFTPPKTAQEKAQSEAVFQNLAAPYVRPTIVHLEAGHEEPEGADYVSAVRRPTDGYAFSGTVMTFDADGDAAGAVFVDGAIGSAGPFGTATEAESAAIEWAANQGAKTLYVLTLDEGQH